MAALDVAGRRHQGERPGLGQAPKFGQRVGGVAGGQLVGEAGRELVETLGAVAVPAAQLGRGRDVTQPPADAWIVLTEPARPHPVDQYPLAVVGIRVLVHPSDLHAATAAHEENGTTMTDRDPDAATTRDRLAELQRWEDSGAHWRVVARTSRSVTVALLTCDGGEEVDRFSSEDFRLLDYIGDRPNSEE